MSLRENDIDLKRLKSKYAIEQLFADGTVLNSKHLIFRLAKESEGQAFYAGVSVSKRNFKKAVDRNRIKRQLRVALKKHESNLSFPGNGMLIFKARKALSTLAIIEETKSLLENCNEWNSSQT